MIETSTAQPEVMRPHTLKEGDLVALVAPSGPVPPERAAAAVDVLVGWGLRVRMGAYALGRHTYFAGTDEERLDDLNAALRDEEVRGVLCLRGGYGMQRIVDGVDLAAVAEDPKLVMGFSDITALHLALWCETRLATVHGPVAAQFDRGADSTTVLSARRALMTSEDITVRADETENTFGVRTSGRAEGVLLGGNLAMLASTVGTRHAPDLTDAVLLIEDVNEEPYRVDRMLTHLLRAGWLNAVRGIAVGQFTDCVDEGRTTVEDVLTERLAALGVPVLGGLPIGHGEQQTAVGLGVPAVLDADAGTLVVRMVGR
jgi:muramoyltetrapeptide carboxypeptidase